MSALAGGPPARARRWRRPALVSLHRGGARGGHPGAVRPAPGGRPASVARGPRPALPGRRHRGRLLRLRARAAGGRRGGGRRPGRARALGLGAQCRRAAARSTCATSSAPRPGRLSGSRTSCWAPRCASRRERLRRSAPRRSGSSTSWSAAACCCTCATPCERWRRSARCARGQLLCTDQVDLGRSLWAPRSPLFRLDGTSGITQWWLPNAAGHRQMLRAAGFELERESRALLDSLRSGPSSAAATSAVAAAQRGPPRLTGNDGVAHHAVLARRG